MISHFYYSYFQCRSDLSSRSAVAVIVAALMVIIATLACSSDNAAPSAVPSPTSTKAPDPTIAPTSETDGDPAVDTALATAFAEWGPTCLNGVYPAEAPQLDDVDAAQYLASDNGLNHYIVQPGEGVTPDASWDVDVQYTGWLADGCIFDSSYTRSQSAIFPVSAVIPGWQMVLKDMKMGERRRVEIPPDLAYGATGNPPVIPENATLTFDIILVGGASKEMADVAATQVADDLFIEATRQAETFDPVTTGFAPITIDYFEDAQGFLNEIPAGERACMAAYAGGMNELEAVFSAETRAPWETFVDDIDSCLSETTARNIVIGRILVVESELSDDTLSCMEAQIKEPTLKPLFGIFSETGITRQWITTHFCMNPEERVAFDNSLYGNTPGQAPAELGRTFVDMQECMTEALGEEYFAPVERPLESDVAAMEEFYNNFSEFMVADLRCQGDGMGSPLPDGTLLTAEIARCVIDDIGATRFGETILDRAWLPTPEDHVAIASAFVDCGANTDFVSLPDGFPTLADDQISCLAEELNNSDDAAQTSWRAFTDIGQQSQLKAGDISALLFGSMACNVSLLELPADTTLSDQDVLCIVGKMDQSIYSRPRAEVLAEFARALSDSSDCIGQN